MHILDSETTNIDKTGSAPIGLSEFSIPILYNITEATDKLGERIGKGLSKVTNRVITMKIMHVIDTAAESVKKELTFYIDSLAGFIKKVVGFFLFGM